MFYEIYALKCGEIGVPGPEAFYMSEWDKWYRFNCYIWVIKGSKKPIVVDTGLRNVDEINPLMIVAHNSLGEKGKFKVGPSEGMLSLLGRVNVDPEDVSHVIATHLHYDHISNISLFTKAEIFISKIGWLNVMAPKYPQLVPPIIFPRDVYAFLAEKAWDRLHLVHEEEILPGIKVFWIGGHTPCSQAVAIETIKGTAVITGDTVFLYRNIEENIPVGQAFNQIECLDAMERIRKEAKIMLPAHDPEVLERFPSGKIPST